MTPLTPLELGSTGPDAITDNLFELKRLFPEAFSEGGINFDVLKLLLGTAVDERDEKYALNWFGKRQAQQLSRSSSAGTLRPKPEESVAWDETSHLMIEGDNLEVLKLLKKSYSGRVKAIYIDPPYNTGKDFIYPDDFTNSIQNYLEVTGQIDTQGRRLSSNTEASGRFHTDWLNMMYPRLRVAQELLTSDGAIFISIDDHEAANLRKISDEIFGEENFIAQLVWKSGRTAAAHYATQHEYVLCYARNKATFPLFKYEGEEDVSDRATKRPSAKNPISRIEFPAGIRFESPDKIFPEKFGDKEPIVVANGVFEAKNGILANPVALEAAWSMREQIIGWLAGEDVIDQKGQKVTEFFFKKNGVLQYVKERGTIHPPSVFSDATTKQGSTEVRELMGPDVFSYPKPVALVRYLLDNVVKSGDIALDFFAGSGTTAHAIMAANSEDNGTRRFILVQLPEELDPDNDEQRTAALFCDSLGRPRNIAELTKERVRRAIRQISEDCPTFEGDLGFRVFGLDSSNIEAWQPDKDRLQRSLEDSINHLKSDRTEADILFELLLRLGFDLLDPVERTEIGPAHVYRVGAGRLFACLAKSLPSHAIETVALGIADWYDRHRNDADATVVFRDSAFADDVAKANLVAILHQRGLTNVRSI